MTRRQSIRVSNRDVRILEALGTYGVLDRELCHAVALREQSSEWCRQILARLAEAGLLRATTLRVWHEEDSRGGRIPILYALTDSGAEVVRLRTGVPPRRVMRKPPSPATHYHRLFVARVMVAFDLAASRERLQPISWILEQDSRSDVPKNARPQERRVLHHEFQGADGTTIAFRPDAAAVLTIPHVSGNAADATSLGIYFEIDLSQESVAQTQSKLRSYAALFETRAYTRYWPDLRNPVLRVFFIVPGQKRIQSLTAAFRSSPIAEAFRFSTFSDLQPDRLLTEPIWCDTQGRRMTLYRKVHSVATATAPPPEPAGSPEQAGGSWFSPWSSRRKSSR